MGQFIRVLNTLLLATTLVALSACGGSSGGGSGGTGQLSVIITDGPTDIYERVLITLTRMTLIGSGGQQVVYDGAPITFDLLQLRDRADFAFSQQIAVGDYNKIRLEVTRVTLVDLGNDVENPVEVTLDDLPANGKIDLNPQGPFTIVAGKATVVELDIDARRSFQVVETGNGGLKFRPVIFVNVYDDDIVLPNRMTRVFGTVEAVDEGNSSLRLCNLQFVAQLDANPNTNSDTCVEVFGGGAKHFGDDGLAFDFAALAAAIDGADPAYLTAIGFPSLPDSTLAEVVLHLDAVITEFGPRRTDAEAGWETTTGTVATDLTMDNCAASQCLDFQATEAATTVTVQLQPETRVFTRDGTEIAQTDLGTGVKSAYDGLRIDEGDVEEVRASMFITGPNAGGEPILVSGTLTTVTPHDTFEFVLAVLLEDESTVSVCVTDESDVLQILVDDEIISIVDLLDPTAVLPNPADGLHIEAGGEPPGDTNDQSCHLIANLVIIE